MATKTIYSNRGTRREIPEERYEEFKTAGWHDTNPLDTPEETPPETAPVTPPTPIAPETVPEAPPIEPQAITPEQLAPVAPTEDLTPDSPYQPIQDVFGPEWKPQPIFEQLGLTEQGIWGAVRTPNSPTVYLIGEGGRPIKDPEEYRETFGTLSQEGIVGEVSVEQAKKLGINIEPDALLSELGNDLFITPEMTPEEKIAVTTDIFSTYDEKYGIEELRKQRNVATQALIDSISGMAEEFKGMKEEERERLGLESKSKAIVDAQKAHSDLLSVYTKYINDLNYSTMTSAHISGAQSKARSQAAVELAPLAMAISIAGDDYNRAAEQLSEYMNDWQMGMEWSLEAAQMQINLLGENLSEAQEKSKTEAQTHLNFVLEDYEQKKADQEQTKSLMMAYNGLGAGINIDDSFSDAMRKVSPYIKSEVAMEKRLKEIGLESAEIGLLIDKKNLAKPWYKPTGIAPTAPDLKRLTLFENEIDKGIKQLQQGESWGRVWDSIRRQFPEVTNDQIDTALGGGVKQLQAVDELGQPISTAFGEEAEPYGWARPGAYEEYKAKQEEGKEGIDSKWERESTVWQWLETDEAKNLSDEAKASQIRSYGLNPETFGIY